MSKSQINELLQFLNLSPTSWHAIENVKQSLLNSSYELLHEHQAWNLQPGKKYFVIRNGSLCAFVTPKKEIQSNLIVASHTDSPGFKLKPNAEFRKENMIMLGLEVYGGPLITSWLNRDLGIAGKVTFLNKKQQIDHSLITLNEYPVIIPQLAIHLDRKVNDEGLLLNKQEQLAAIAALDSKKNQLENYLENRIKEKVHFETLLSYDLFVYPLEKAALVGFQEQMIASYRIDSLISVHAILNAATHTQASKHTLKFIALSDQEEIGSSSAQGAGSPFIENILERILLSFNHQREDYLRLLRQSLCVSVDLSHALHPNYSDRHEPRHAILMDQGIAVKFNAQQKYASDSSSSAEIIALCKKLSIPFQFYVSRGDIASGSTIGPIFAERTGIPTVDIGCTQLSMHSCRELASCQDYLAMSKLLSELLK